ncbi:MAG: hypothetical protein A4E64_00412 [Syntrophorhabdus sp. PtaU1.Bin058]|nr:MAG: hypothetical protein A4E64_00412 [Syntrophorhabdus sp. PtaU1.Bin058]
MSLGDGQFEVPANTFLCVEIEKICRQPLGHLLQREVFDEAGELLEAYGKRPEHIHCKGRVLPDERCKCRPRYEDNPAFPEGLGVRRERSSQKHGNLRKRFPGFDNVEYLLFALRRQFVDLHAARDNDVKTICLITFGKDHLSARKRMFRNYPGQLIDLRLGQSLKERVLCEKIVDPHPNPFIQPVKKNYNMKLAFISL